MERERFYSEPESAPSLVPDTIPDELIAAYQADARAVVAASVTPVRRALRPRTRGQRIQAVLALLAGYLGLASLTGWWWSLAQASSDSVWWTVTVVGAAGLAVAALALLGRAAMGLVRRRRRRLTAGTRR